ncbi:MAG: hypothetical protein JRJ19_01850 [Deltaproteobacteria bacterium]|nr:hypothetical protein [Deltaproteobacteria bacterium]MBW1870775.1 hypothetical protein [Deltaproteobacteria bacterium]
MGIFGKGDHRHSDPRVRLEAVAKLVNQDELVKVACGDDSPRVRLAAAARVEGDAALAEIAKQATELDVRLAVVERISSQQLLADIIKTRKNFQLMGACFSRITDKGILESIAEDTGYNPTARRIAVEQFADESYLSDMDQAAEKPDDPGGKELDIDGLCRTYGGLRMVRAIGRFRRSPKALHALGKVARQGGEAGELAVEYLCRSLDTSNPKLQACAIEELTSISDPDLVACLVRALDDSKRREPILMVLKKIETPEAREALAQISDSENE